MSKEGVNDKYHRVPRWYFGGLASTGAACFTHPLDLLKVQMQTHMGKNISMLQLTGIVVKNQGKYKFDIDTYIEDLYFH